MVKQIYMEKRNCYLKIFDCLAEVFIACRLSDWTDFQNISKARCPEKLELD